MLNFPSATVVHRRIPKESFYEHLSFTKVLKEKFKSDVDKIIVENVLTKENLNLNLDSEVKEILLLFISVKHKNFDGKVLEAIARQNKHKLLFLLKYEDFFQLAIYHKKLYRMPWVETAETEANVKLVGFSMDDIWNSLIEQIAIPGNSSLNKVEASIDERLDLQERITKLKKLIKKLEAASWREQQPKKKYELYSRLKCYREQLKGLEDGTGTLTITGEEYNEET